MKQEFLNHQATLLYHMFEKDCKKMFPKINNKKFINNLEEKLINLNIATDNSSSWYKINKELRLISNVIKHGKGSAYYSTPNPLANFSIFNSVIFRSLLSIIPI
jgi:hypothetical protein